MKHPLAFAFRIGFACIGILVAAASLPAVAGQLVAFRSDAAPGSIVIQTAERRLYLIVDRERAIRYVVGVGAEGRQWTGRSRIAGRYLEPNWAPPVAIRRESPGLPLLIAGGAQNNPMGAAAMTLDGVDYGIHGTNAPGSIGGFVSHGCIRMLNEDVLDLLARVRVGTPVEVRL